MTKRNAYTGRFTSKSKYGNKRTVVDNITFASQKEAKRYQDLKLLEKAGKIRKLDLQVPFKLDVNGFFICIYVADFTYDEILASGPLWTYVVEDAKGVRTPVYKLKARLMRAVFNIVVRET